MQPEITIVPRAMVIACGSFRSQSKHVILLRFVAGALLFSGIQSVSAESAPGSLAPGPTPTPTPAPSQTPFEEIVFLEQNFDLTSPPNLPSGWQTSFATGPADCTPTGTCTLGSNWTTSTTNPGEGPVAVFHDAPDCVTDSYLVFPSFFVPNFSNLNAISVSFIHNFDFEPGRDGGVLEMAYDGGCFFDVVGAGGSINSYNGTIDTGFSSPIAGRRAWTGNSGGYVFGGASLPGSARGHTVTLRFRLATDCSGSSGSWRIDRVRVSSRFFGGGTPAPTVTPTPASTPPPPACTLNQTLTGFTLFDNFWLKRNNSSPFGPTDWSSGNTSRFPSHAGSSFSYIAADSYSACGFATISQWLMTPQVALQNGAQFSFWTRTVSVPIRPDRLQVRMSTNGSSSNVGGTPTSVGDFTTLLLDINPTYTAFGYPNTWTKYTVTLTGLGLGVAGRLAFRYFAENGGPLGTNSDYIGIDSISYNCQPGGPTPTPPPGAISISGRFSYCSESPLTSVTNAVVELSGTASGEIMSDSFGNYIFSGLAPGNPSNYFVSVSKSDVLPSSAGISTIDILAVQRHFLGLSLIPSGCRRGAADVNDDGGITTVDAIAIQRFVLSLPSGTGDVGRYQFNPLGRSYFAPTMNLSAQDYGAFVTGDVAPPFVP